MEQIQQSGFLGLVDSSIDHLMKNKELSIDSICLQLRISRSHLHRKLKSLTGLSTALYLRKKRMAYAKRLLATTDQNISEIAYEVGIPSPQNLSKYFQQEYQLSPTEYRTEAIRQARANSKATNASPENLSSTQQSSIAILPFVSHTAETHFSDGMAEEILYSLSQLDNLNVAGRASSFYFKNSQEDIVLIGRKLRVAHVLTGTIRISDQKVRVIVTLYTTSDGYQVWTEKYDRELEDIFQMQEDIARKIVQKLSITLLQKENESLIVKPKTKSIRAYDLYLKGRLQFELRSDLDLSMYFFEEATKLDPSFVHAYFGMAYAMLYKCIFAGCRPMDALDKIQTSYEQAVKLQPTAAEGYIINAWLKFYFDYDFDAAIGAFDQAIHYDPMAMDAYRIKAYFYAFHGDYDRAIPLAEKAYSLDPLGYNAWFSLADIYRRAAQYDKAIDLFLPLIPKFPDNALLNEILALSYYHKGDLLKARLTFSNQQALPLRVSIWTVGRYIFHYYHGDKNLLPLLLDHLEKLQSEKWIQPTILALINFHLGHEAQAIQYLAQAYEERDFGLKHIISEPHWDLFRSHPTVVEVLHQVS